MNQQVTEAIILNRTDYGEADRILTLLTPQHGKLSLLAKGVRRVKSKLAGGIELFSVSTITFVQGRGSVGTLVSTRLVKHYGHIVEDLDRTMLGYELIKQFHKLTADEPGPEYFELLRELFAVLDDSAVPLPFARLWFQAALLRLGGHTPNLQTDAGGAKLQPDRTYDFDVEAMCLTLHDHGRFQADGIKFLRLACNGTGPKALAAVKGGDALLQLTAPLVNLMVARHLV